ncbi:Glycosyltransferase involved in cell wall bisynthesis [Filimonas lacunae]|uniref:Glycosyltransferase involved in cell wall bisynthesis n=1 Tax=Filimonas lacunae TaxID=477680 RepID=A0A173MS88_9BACT|nr:glycosyltransferase [Filimonas lacunae]BAV10228.1 glycosyltransferase [Filimonas lacunae]SIT18048.1 Glycosyltransferase involved in cell wall bisynthesis [Filimonas lacunae]
MLKGKNIIILGSAKFDSPIESTTITIARFLAAENTVYYIDYPLTWKDYFDAGKKEEVNRRKPFFFSSALMSSDLPGFHIGIVPPVASINILPEGKLYRAALRFNQQRIIGKIKKLIRRYSITDYIFINSFNFHYPDIAAGLRPSLTAYHCVDPLVVDYDKKHGVISEKILVSQSDLVVCTSRQLYEEKKLQNKDSYFIANAADVSHSSKALNDDVKVYDAIAALPSPVMGYFGNIERRMDFDLLKQVVAENKDKSFAFVGPYSKEFVPDWFFHTPNIHLIGKVPYQDMPAVVKGFDVAMIPFKKDEFSRTIFPLKLFEYLGAGKPVIATDFNPDLQEFTEDAVFYCASADAFTAAIEKALAEENEVGKKQQRIHIAAQNTWDKRGQAFSELLASYLKPSSNPQHS